MRKYIILLLMLVTTIGYSQNANVFIDAFNVDPLVLKNGKIEYFNSQTDTSINFGVVIGRNSGLLGGPTQVLALAVFDNYGTEYNASDTIALTQSDFSAYNGTSTEFINKTFKLLSEKKEGTLRFKYKFRINGGGYDDWTNWFYTNKTYQTKKYEPPVPAAVITGPNQICDEETYTITNPGTISLENATGIATLTDLGNNQWKVTRIGSARGNVILKSTVGSNIKSKSIQVGTKTYNINGLDAIGYDGGIYSFYVSHDHGNTYSWSITGLPTGATVEGANTNTVKIKMPFRTGSHPTGGRIIMNVTVNTICGAAGAGKQITYGVVPPPPGGGSGGGGGDDPLHPEPVLP